MRGQCSEVKFLSGVDTAVLTGKVEINVLIPAHNSERRVGGVIANLGRQWLPGEVLLRVMVCANACGDNTAVEAQRALNRIKKPGKVETELIETSEAGQPQALNTMVARVPTGGRKQVVIELQDDSFPGMGALAVLAAAACLHPELGAIGVVPRAIPTYRSKNAGWGEKVAFVISKLDYYSREVLIDRLCAFDPEVMGEFPDLASVDLFMVQEAMKLAGGYGIIDPCEAVVFNRVPETLLDLVRQRLMYLGITKQMIRAYPDYRELVGQVRGPRVKRVFKDFLFSDCPEGLDFGMGDRIGALVVMVGTRIMAGFYDKLFPYQSSKRGRINSAI